MDTDGNTIDKNVVSKGNTKKPRSVGEISRMKKFSKSANPYIRVGTDYFKEICKVDRFGITRTELKPWKKDEIRTDHGIEIFKKIPKYDDFVILPDNMNCRGAENNCYNLYREFSHRPSQGQWYWTDILIKHIFGEQYSLGLRYLQILYISPERMSPILVLVSRERQTGKTTFINWLNMVFGSNMTIITPDDLQSNFNSSYATSNIIAIEETCFEKSVTIEKLKALATGKFISVNQKYVNPYKIPFFGKIILTSNNEDKFARIDEEEIRFFIRKVTTPQISNHDIEADLVKEIPAFLHYLTTLPDVDFTKDRTGFTPDELVNESLQTVKAESKSTLYKTLKMQIESLFLNELSSSDSFLADALSVKAKFFQYDGTITAPYIRQVLKNEFCLLLSDPQYFNPFGNDPGKTARAYSFKREQFTDEPSKGKKPF